MSYLMIENRVNSIPSVDMLITIGASGSRGKNERIGQFGSGFPYSIALFAREGLLDNIKLCLGKEVYTFLEQNVNVKTGSGDNLDMTKIDVKKQNGGRYALNISKGFGEIDWTDIVMGVREFVSNAFDGSMESFGDYKNVTIKEVEDNQCRAKEGTIRFFIPMRSDIKRYFMRLHEFFLMVDPTYDPALQIIHNTDNETRFYRKGVFVGTIAKKGTFHYNIPTLDLKESRNLDQWSAYCSAGHAILLADQATIEKYLKVMIQNDRQVFETNIDECYLKIDDVYYSIREAAENNRETWKKAYANVFHDTLVSNRSNVVESVVRQGFKAILVSDRLFEIIKDKGIPIADSLLTLDELAGRIISDPTHSVTASLGRLWELLASKDLTRNKIMPMAKCFYQPMAGESQTLGYYKDNCVFIHTDIATSDSHILNQTMLEEIAHYITGSGDNSRDFQDFAFRLATVFMTASQSSTDSDIDIKEYLRNVSVTIAGNPARIVGWKNPNNATIIDDDNGVSNMIGWDDLYRDVKSGRTDF